MPPSRTAIAAHFGLANFPVAYCGLKIITSLALRFPDFQRSHWSEPEPNR
ncbi:Serine/threonine protein kinase [methanotrophic endosymbiont of Bathymodiolus azoricus (Menez Gwen)]|nr:Serine/threonine protein kinase [methanotrophic endosymbiont of Bathymodiolus azoricus (Menez Gwen)]